MNDWFGFSANTSIYVLYAIFLAAAGAHQHVPGQHHARC